MTGYYSSNSLSGLVKRDGRIASANLSGITEDPTINFMLTPGYCEKYESGYWHNVVVVNEKKHVDDFISHITFCFCDECREDIVREVLRTKGSVMHVDIEELSESSEKYWIALWLQTYQKEVANGN